MTDKQKLMVYHHVRQALHDHILGKEDEDRGKTAGFCFRLSRALSNFDIEGIDSYEEGHFERFFPELYKYKPAEMLGRYWFPRYDYQIRFEIILKVIADMEASTT